MFAKQKRIIWAMLCIVTVVLSGFVFAATRGANNILPNAAAKGPSTNRIIPALATTVVSSSLQTPENGPIEAEIITILPTGFNPSEIKRPKGPFTLEVEDRSGLKEVNVQLSVQRGRNVFQVKAPRERSDWNRLV